MIRVVVEDQPSRRKLSMNIEERAVIRIEPVTSIITMRVPPRIVGISPVCESCKIVMGVNTRFCARCGRPVPQSARVG